MNMDVGHMRMATLLSWGVAPGYHEFGLRPKWDDGYGIRSHGTMNLAFGQTGGWIWASVKWDDQYGPRFNGTMNMVVDQI
jgi:hypothetical protein